MPSSGVNRSAVRIPGTSGNPPTIGSSCERTRRSSSRAMRSFSCQFKRGVGQYAARPDPGRRPCGRFMAGMPGQPQPSISMLAMTLPTEPIGSIPRPQALQDGMQAAAAGTISADGARSPVRRRRARHASTVRGHGLTGRHRRRTAQAELRDLPGGRPGQPRRWRRDDPVRGRPHPPAAAPDGRPVPLRDEGLVVPRRRSAADDRPAEAGGDLGVGASASCIRRMGSPAIRAKPSSTTWSAEAAAEIRGCLERGAIVQIDFTEARLSLKLDPSKGLLDAFVDLNNQVLGRAHRRRTSAGRRPHLSRRRPGLDPQRRHRLRGAAARAVPAEPGHVLRPARQRGRSRARAQDLGRARHRRPPDLRRRDRPDRPARSRRPRRSAIGSSRRRGSSTRATSARPTTAASRRSATTPRRRATRRSRRSRRGSPGPRWRPAHSASEPSRARRARRPDQPPAPGGRTATLSQRSPVARRMTNVFANGDVVRAEEAAGGVVGLLGDACPGNRRPGSGRSARRTAPARDIRRRRRSGSGR